MKKTVITSEQSGFFDYVKRVWQYRALIRVLAKRDIKIRYSQTALGILWSVLQPLIAIAIYTVFFYYILGVSSGKVPYPLFVLPGIIGWFQFTHIINAGGMSLLNNPDLIRRIDFPKLVLPLSQVLSGLLEVLITLGLMLILMAAYGYTPSLRIAFVPLFIMLNALAGLSISLWLSALTIKYRDFHHVIPYLISFGIWITPVFYPTTILPDSAEQYMFLNPVAVVIAGLRWCLVEGVAPAWYHFAGFIPVMALFALGYRYFYSVEQTIVDHV
ncbi:MAG: ABC transporter permease [Flavobacteriales bacterium]|nr:ABC transporter permease [Flavobacteriales bacterium]MCB9205120.1 ABC transporter permease [Flavobacteriales bacterium]